MCESGSPDGPGSVGAIGPHLMRLGATFVAVCMVIIAGSASAIVYLYFGIPGSEAAMVGIATLTALALYNTVTTRSGVRTAVGRQLAELSRGGADLARQVAEIGRRLAATESKVEIALGRTRAVTDPLTMEIGELGTLVKQLAETVSSHQTTLDTLERAPSAPPASVLAMEALAQRLAVASPAPAEPAAPAPPAEAVASQEADANLEADLEADPETQLAAEPAALAPVSPTVPTQADVDASNLAAALASIRIAIDANRVDLYLQPIVTLPQRKVRYYEAMSRLRNERGEVLHATDFVPQAERGGLMPKIDNLVIFRCVQVVRRLLLKNSDIGLFCNLSGATLTDSMVFPQFLQFLEANRAIAHSLVLEFTQGAVRGMGPIEHESLAALAERGFTFSMDNVTDLRIEPRELANRGFRFIKIQASLLLNRSGTATSDIHPADLSDLVGRFGIDLIAERIESEGSVVDLLDYDVRFGQGFLFAPPRPVRAEALQGIADRSDVVVREAGPAPNPVAPMNTVGRSADAPAPGASKPERTTGLAQLARGVVSRG
jgi:cyclic-di-GMP phosphodiesterase, flagellum assembly factor TipF